jgi:hypothetical protein
MNWARQIFSRGAGAALLAQILLTASCLAARDKGLTLAPAPGVYFTNVALTLGTRAPAASIRYTLDGTEPGETSPLYTQPILITNTLVVRARLFHPTAPPGPVTAAIYTRAEPELESFTSKLPLLIVNAFGAGLGPDTRIEGGLQVMDGGAARSSLGGTNSFSSRALLAMRGRASLRYPKNSFTVKLIDGAGDPDTREVLGLPADDDWVLYAPYPDKSLIRDVLAYELNSQMGHWAPRTRLVEVFVNRTGTRLSRRDYAGVYVFEERVKRGRSRVNIEKLGPDDHAEPALTGGYIFKKDHTDSAGGPVGGEGYGAGPVSQSTKAGYPTGPGGFPGAASGFLPPARTTVRVGSSSSSSRSSRTPTVVTNHYGFAATLPPGRESESRETLKDEESFRSTRTNEFYFVEPEPDEITAVQKAWLRKHLNDLEAALHGPDFRDPQKGYRAFLDPESFVDYHLFTEMTKNVDGYRFSVFYHKDRGGKVKADPVWDWNLSFGNANGKQGWIPEYWLWPQLDDREYTWYRRLFEDPDFAQLYVDRWAQLRTNVFATKRILARVDELAAQLQEAQKRNYQKWPILGRPINPQWYSFATYEEEIGWLKKFIEMRLAWMEKQFLPVPAAVAKPGGPVTLRAAAGEIVYTLDGSDPRATGGGLAPTAKVYQNPVSLTEGRLFARTREGNRWSGPLVLP